MEIDEALQAIVNANIETPELLLRSWLDKLYFEAPRQGLSSSQLKSLINFVCESDLLSISTKFYIVENCLIPSDYIHFEVVEEVARHLGTANALSAYRLQVPSNLQVALCKWLVHIFFLVIPVDKSSLTYGTIWIHLWQYNFLQRWLTYIVVWSTKSIRDVRPWKVQLLERIASKPGYTDGQACATLILKRYASLLGPSKSIPSVLSRINCNARRLRSLQELKLDNMFISKLRKVLTNNLNFTNEMIDELISSHLNQLNSESKSNAISRYNSKVPKGKESVLQIRSFDQLAWNWHKLVVSKDVEQIINNYISWFSLFQLTKNDPVWMILEDWILIQLRKCFKNHTRDFLVIKKIVRLCQIHPILTNKIFDEFLTYDYLRGDPIVFLYIYRKLTPLLVPNPSHIKGLHKDILQLLTFCHLDKGTKIDENSTPQICSNLLLTILNWFEEDVEELIPLGLEFLHDFRILLTANMNYTIENRFITTALILALKILPKNKNKEDFQLRRITFPFSLMNKLITFDDPLLLDACCEYLVMVKEFLTNKEGSNKYVQGQNLHIMDLTNYLWRNKILSSKKFLDIPTDFVRNVLDNLFLPNVRDRIRFPFSITGIPALSFIFGAKLFELENDLHCKIRFSGLMNEENFRKFIKEIQHSQVPWIPDIRNVDDLKIAILKFTSNDGPFQHISLFLFTFLKSLSHYINN
ncbi:hypothetical protein ZYGR_0AG05090 [Zygosaccharomyces rouxii]|uniref:Uncharacterized protein n=1 Tax=Zygosaccharomyces rouxii TaxID=4956 RepID=A0A1Q3AA55_ZYGRO|nr:hypothetical protein ZYGR_0AG05090 [Zygosaccharomyces rouxii]